MHYAILASIIAASLLGAAAMSVVHAAEAPAAEQTGTPQPAPTAADRQSAADTQTRPAMELLPVDVTSESNADSRSQRNSYYGQGFESRGINVDNLPRSRPGYGRRPASH